MTEGADRVRTAFGAFLRDVGDELAGVVRPVGVTTPVDRSTWRQLYKSVTPVPGESLRGLVARSCRVNYLPNSFGMLQHLGLVHRNRVIVSEDPNIDPAELAWAMQVAETEVLARRYDPLGRGRVSFYGLEINAQRIEISRRLFSPTVFGMADDNRPPFHRAVWELRDIPFCLEGWDMLQDTCYCKRQGVLQGWSRTGTKVEECDACGDPLAGLEPFPVPERMRPALAILKALILPIAQERSDSLEKLPDPLRQVDRGKLYRVLVRLADEIDPNASDNPVDDPERRLGALHSACHALRQWPAGLSDVQLAPGATPHARTWIQTAWNNLARVPRSSVRREKLPQNDADVRDAPVGIRRATEVARLSPEVLNAAWEHRLVTRHERRHGKRTLPAFDPIELVGFGQVWRERREPDSLAYDLGLPRYGLEDIAAHNGIVADGLAIPGTGPHFTPTAVQSFLQAVEDAARPIVDTIPLTTAMRLVGGRLKPWGAAFMRLISGDLPFELMDGKVLVDRIRIERSRAHEVSTLELHASNPRNSTAMMVQNDALEVLNASFDMKHLLSGLPSKGRNPRYYRRVDVERLAATVATIPEIAARLWLDPATAYQELGRRDLLKLAVAPGAWPRSILPDLG